MASLVKTRRADVVLRVELLGIEPLIWRRLRVDQSVTFQALHEVLQRVMGWQDSHLHEFHADELAIGMMDVDEPRKGLQDENAWSLGQLLETGVSEFEYLYDFGDDWLHRVIVEPTSRGKAGGSGPLCLAGENACPPEDVGGPPGYALFLQALADPKHENHKQYVEWIGGIWDPKGFDLNRINRDLRALPRGRGRRTGTSQE
jgi:pRiA4b ORF-3-like protein